MHNIYIYILYIIYIYERMNVLCMLCVVVQGARKRGGILMSIFILYGERQ